MRGGFEFGEGCWPELLRFCFVESVGLLDKVGYDRALLLSDGRESPLRRILATGSMLHEGRGKAKRKGREDDAADPLCPTRLAFVAYSEESPHHEPNALTRCKRGFTAYCDNWPTTLLRRLRSISLFQQRP